MVRITPYTPDQRDELVQLSLRSWELVFPLTQPSVPAFVYESFYPSGWRERLSHDLARVLDDEPQTVDVAMLGTRPAGWVSTRLHPEDSMGEIYVLAVDPDLHRQGIGTALIDHSVERVQRAGMRMIMVETGGDPGHEPARLTYERTGFERWPVARYFKDLSA